ncbi:hypothetical protein [Actinocrinis sp.]|uniref:hypothetical protein n=1 Tax=Actinocrinis sp. TaxID=1920516 RepID=UPI002DDD4C87|nr:hypothetical protein [Actinocrinis sp.]
MVFGFSLTFFPPFVAMEQGALPHRAPTLSFPAAADALRRTERDSRLGRRQQRQFVLQELAARGYGCPSDADALTDASELAR